MQLNTAQRLIEESFGVDDAIGRVVTVRGSNACIGLRKTERADAEVRRVTVGDFLGIRSGRAMIISVVTDVSLEVLPVAREQGLHATATVDMVGEIKAVAGGEPHFERGVSIYPAIGDMASMLTENELRLVYGLDGPDVIDIGRLHHDIGLNAHIHVDEMMQKHFAILGTTGVGKSSGVAVILRAVMERRPNLRIFLIDAHNEYANCFDDRAQALTPANLRLPFWLFNFEEIVDVFFRGRPGVDEEVEILSDLIPAARRMYEQTPGRVDRTASRSDAGYTVDTPVPYRLTDLFALIDDRMGKLENRSSRMTYNKLLQRISSVVNDPRYAFMFEAANVGGDTMAAVLSQLFRLPIENRPMTIMQLAGFPAEVVDSVVSVLGRMAFDFGLWSDGALPILFVCEEAHRYASANRDIGFGPTRRAISRIAKEGRKYGVFLGLVSQRPAELDPTILSQCSTLFVMRMANDRDQEIVRSAVSDAAASLLAFVPSLGTREVFAFGEGVALPTRLKFKELPPEYLPRSEAVSDASTDFGRDVDRNFIDVVIDRWRGATLNNRLRSDEGPDGISHRSATSRLDPDQYRLLKKPAPGTPPQSTDRRG
jgi:DNA helicase HerA-like ATPase